MLYAQHKRIGGEIRSHHHTERTKIKQQKINTIYTVTSGHTRNEKKPHRVYVANKLFGQNLHKIYTTLFV